MIFRPRYGRIGTLAFGHILVVDMLGPIAEVLGYVLVPTLWLVDLLSIDYLLAFLALTTAFGVALSVGAFVLEELETVRYRRVNDLFKLFIAAVLENFGYRQLNNNWRLCGWLQYLRGERTWGAMTREGFAGGTR